MSTTDLETALLRAEAHAPSSSGDLLTAAEDEARADAERLERDARIERTAAEVDDAAAAEARRDADELRHERVMAEQKLASTEQALAEADALRHEVAAEQARAVAADAASRKRTAGAARKSNAKKPSTRSKGTSRT